MELIETFQEVVNYYYCHIIPQGPEDTSKVVIDEIRKTLYDHLWSTPLIHSAVIQAIDTGWQNPLQRAQDGKVLFS